MALCWVVGGRLAARYLGVEGVPRSAWGAKVRGLWASSTAKAHREWESVGIRPLLVTTPRPCVAYNVRDSVPLIFDFRFICYSQETIFARHQGQSLAVCDALIYLDLSSKELPFT